MLIKHNSLTVQLPKQFPALFFLLGQELFQINQLAEAIKLAWGQYHPHDNEITIFSIENTADWDSLEQKANSYSLFTNASLIDIRYNKKTLEGAGKTFLLNYLADPNPNYLLLFRAPNLSSKHLQFILSHQFAYIIQTITPNPIIIKKWLHNHLQQFGPLDPGVSTLIYQFNEGNLFACAQLLEKLALITEPGKPLTLDDIKDHLYNQCHYALFELGDACLAGDALKAIQFLRLTYSNKTEPTLILWLLTQEIRLLMQLSHLTNQGSSFQAAVNELKIWSTKSNLYKAALKKYNFKYLSSLLIQCNKIDMKIKSTQSKQVWQSLELLALSLCTGEAT